VKLVNHFKPLFGSDGFDPVYSSGSLSLVVLRDPPYCEVSRCPGLHQEFLEFLDCSCVATLFSSKDALLYAIDMLLKLAPGQLVPTLTLRIRRLLGPGCLRICHTTDSSFFQIIVPTLAYSGHYP
jgi:hypothetical protein